VGSLARISPDSGNLPTSPLEKIRSPSTVTSKIPFPPSMSSGLVPVFASIAAASLEASGRKFQAPQ
jgi:hypothetical protein